MRRTLAGTDVEGYFQRTLGLKIQIKPVSGTSLPFYLASLYSVTSTEIEGRRLLLCELAGDEQPSPAQLKKHAAELRERTSLEPVFVLPSLSSWNRARLIEARVAFVVPGRQLYLPTLLIDLREHFARERERPDRLSYPAQFLLLLQLLHSKVEGKTVRELSRELSYSATTMSRAVRELESLALVETGEGKAQPLHFPADRAILWSASLPHLQTPIKALWFVPAGSHLPQLPRAGISALASLSMLNEDTRLTYAISAPEVKLLVAAGRAQKEPMGGQDSLLEVWAYDPKVLSGDASKTVDPLSLYLSLAGENDERVRKALEGLVKELF